MKINNSNESQPVWRAISLAACIALTACNDNTELVDIIEDGETGVVSIKASRDDVLLAVGQTFPLTATTVYDSSALSTISDPITWTSQNDTIASVTSNGTVTAVSPGNVVVSYHWRRISGHVNVQVTDAELASINFSSDQLQANECSEASLAATGLYSDGTTHPLSSISEWSSSDDSVVVIQSQDENSADLLLIDSGSAQVTLTSGPVSASVPVTATDTLSEIRVTSDLLTLESGTEQSLSITGLFTDGTEAAIDTIASYTLTAPQNDASTATGILLDTHPEPDDSSPTEPESPLVTEPEISEVILATSDAIDVVQQPDASLLIRANLPGAAVLTIACGGQTLVLPLTVIDPPVLQSLSFSSTTTDIEPGFTQTLAPIAGYSDGTTVTVSDAQWAIISGDADSFELDSATGEITANPDITLEQSIVLQATFENLTAEIEIVSTGDTSEVIVDTQLYYVDQSGQNVALTTSANSLEVGDTLQLTLKVIYNTGTEEFIVSDLFWSNLNPAIATIDGAGLLTAESPGISTIFAIKDDHVTTFQFTVLAATTTTSSATP